MKYRFVTWHSQNGNGFPAGIDEKIMPALRKIKPIVEEKCGRRTIVVFREFFSDAIHVAESIMGIKEFAMEHTCDVLITPGAGRMWAQLKEKLLKAGITPVCPKEDNKLKRLDSIAIWVGMDGRIYAFPKTANQFDGGISLPASVIHMVPDSDIGIIICKEIKQLSSEQEVSKFQLIIHPSFTSNEDPYLLARTTLYAKVTQHPQWNGTNTEYIISIVMNNASAMHDIVDNLEPANNGKTAHDFERVLTGNGTYTGHGFTYGAIGQTTMQALIGDQNKLVLKVDGGCGVGLMYLPANIHIHMPKRGVEFHILDVDKI